MRLGILPFCWAFLVVLAAPPVPSAGEISQDAYARVNTALVTAHVLPRYARLSGATGSFADAVKTLCDSVDEAGTAQAREDFHLVMDAWMAVQHLKFGPIEWNYRLFRFHFWPQARGKVTRAVRALVEAGDETALQVSSIREANVALQGLLAAEALLFDHEFLGVGDIPGAAECRFLVAVSENMRVMADEIVTEWQDGERPFSTTVAEPGPDNGYFQDHSEATLAFFRSLHDGLQLIADVKLKPIVGDSLETARPSFVESRLSERSLRNVILNLEALEALYAGSGGLGIDDLAKSVDPKLDRLLHKAFRLTLENARSFEITLEHAVTNPKVWPKAKKLATQVQALRQIVRDRLASKLALQVGFNALDGD